MVIVKQVIAVRTDLKMGKGKIAAQVGHACVISSERARVSYSDWWLQWWQGQEKVVLKVPSCAELERIKSEAARMKLPYCMVNDAGHTQLSPGTTTCVSVGPAPEHMIDSITGNLPLL
ncbi:MAG: peptidyl-tRNA hydrolase [Cenarchaeum sp. SB0665_bin_23]|nr:peptidyl-tRNA hydrolase [Cenarchaeum sp. SB0664_bin_35]MXY61831.1 peptidyl-tRNA hydrolase [Cenarchaeum sp. SB0665_bin_23]MYB46295.1 peptidyl-tRNA hydrolase [Cenarchaeum sp. SB0662_bin_33]MYG33801.1 peptidyl-tRNA hydrolase [Cenarchaeum sp. SB0677_bin_16]